MKDCISVQIRQISFSLRYESRVNHNQMSNISFTIRLGYLFNEKRLILKISKRIVSCYSPLHRCWGDSSLFVLARPFPSALIFIHHSSLFPLDDAKMRLLSLTCVHITKDHIPRYRLLSIEAQTYKCLTFPVMQSRIWIGRESIYTDT